MSKWSPTICQSGNGEMQLVLNLGGMVSYNWFVFQYFAGEGFCLACYSRENWLIAMVLTVAMTVWEYVGVVLSVGLLAGVIICFVRHRRRKRRAGSKTVLPFSEASSSSDLDAINFGPRKFSYKELRVATNDFSNEKLLGKGGFGSVYKGVVLEGSNGKEDQNMVAIKRMEKNSKQGEREFLAEVLSIGRLRHRNLASLLGWCHEGDELLLVYEFMAKGSLDQHLHQKLANPSLPCPLTWQTRFQILQGIASALEYLHGGWEKCILHCDIKPSNVLLDAEMTPRLGDFGLAHLAGHTIGNSCSRMTSTPVGGTLGYMAPEVYLYGQLTKKADVYSFGMVALEVVCGRRPQGFHSEENEEENLVEWVWSAYKKGQLLEVIDPFLELHCQHQIMNVLQLGMLCTLLHPPLRPWTSRLMQALRGDWTISLPPSRWHTVACTLPKPSDHDADNLGARRYSYAEIVEATNGFSVFSEFCKESDSSCYKGLIKDQTVAIKRFSTPNSRGEDLHVKLLTLIGKSRHGNLMPLLGWCDEQQDLLLVYDYMDHGCLSTHLYSTTLTWSSRLEILRGVAAAVDYIHNGCQENPGVLHRNIKPKNVMLDMHMTAKLAHPLDDDEQVSSPYDAPELVSGGWEAASVKSDVYSFGVIALEMVFRRPPETILKTGLRADMIDAFFKENGTDDEVMKQQITRVLQLGMLCCLPEANLRPHSNQLLPALYGDWNLLPQHLQLLQECSH
ncbi:hypothetical protein M758_2G135500 [Ceratodon purpureus]|nr:hypothetical protein M758_2G135500 [Ceratodon purpureus]